MPAIPLAMPTAAALTGAENLPPAGSVVDFTRRLVAAEDAAWSEAHARYAHRLLRYLLVATHGDEQAARDALQACFVRAVRHIRIFPTEEALWCWLTLLARHALADARRSTGRWRRFLDRWKPLAPDASHPIQPDPLTEHLASALATLDPLERRLLEEKYFDGTSIRALAREAGTTEKAVESRLARLREKLRGRLLETLRQEASRP
ncbi:MAG: RNA polymerase sigma factor [Verrucomicrobiales bacterium]